MRKRNHVVPVRLNAKELRHLDGQVAKSGLSREEFLRSLILGAQLQTKSEMGEYQMLLGQI